MKPVDFCDIQAPSPDLESWSRQYAGFADAISTGSLDDCSTAIDAWDQLSREIGTWVDLTELRFNQDTTNESYKKAREELDQLKPKITELETRLKRLLLESVHRPELEQQYGKQAFALWKYEVTTYDPVIDDNLVTESKLEADYNELTASAKFDYEGQTYTLSEFGKFRENPNREVRHTTDQMRWQWFDENRQSLDAIYDDQVKLRHTMAKKLGFSDFVEMGYRRMNRMDYGQDDVERYRKAVLEHVTPLAAALRQRQADTLNVDRLMFWDENLLFHGGNPAPQGDHDWMIERAIEMFDQMSDSLGQFFRMMVDCHLMDLKSREGKAGGGFCTFFGDPCLPFIFANFNGTKGDVQVFTHEMGHAYQSFQSGKLKLEDYIWPTYEAAEIHSMSLEFLTWPHMDKFFGDDADRFRQTHLTQSLLFLPYGVAVDHFQHLVYANPEATPAQRFEMWQEVEQIYLPWRDYGDLPHVRDGGFWQIQRHIYLCPFYYIDYTLAQTCALQFWVRSRENYAQAIQDWEALCRLGGSAPFQKLVASAGLISPFAEGCLTEVVQQARKELNI